MKQDIALPQVELVPYDEYTAKDPYDIDLILYDLDCQLDMLSSHADQLDYLLAIASGLLCGAMDILWAGSFDLKQGRDITSSQVDSFVQKTAKLFGWKGGSLSSAVAFLEQKFPLPSDGNTPDFGGGLQHHLRDFAHHPTVIGLLFSLLTQFTYKSYGTNTKGNFIVVDVPEASKAFIGEDVPQKLLFGTFVWFFHLVSDMAGTKDTAGKSGGTGIPGPLLALAKELSALPFFKDIHIHGTSLSVFLSKLFNGTLLARRDETGQIIKDTVSRFDLRGELGLAIELGQQAVPVIANECIVRGVYMIRRLAMEMRRNEVRTLADMEKIDWNAVKPVNDPTLSHMLLVAAGVFTAVDIGEAVINKKYLVAVNYVGVGRFAVAIGEDVAWYLRARDVKKLQQMYQEIKQFLYAKEDERIYERIGADMDMRGFGLTIEQTVILYNLEYQKARNDIQHTDLLLHRSAMRALKQKWLDEWRAYMTAGFPSFLQIEDAQLQWYTEEELVRKIQEMSPQEPWFRLVLLEAMLFEPYYPLSTEKDKKGKEIPSKEYDDIRSGICGFKKSEGDKYLESVFAPLCGTTGYIKRLRSCYDHVLWDLGEVLQSALTALALGAVITLAAVIAAAAFAPQIAVLLVGAQFPGLHGAALVGACLAYLGGGAVAVGGAGMAGGTMVIVGGGAVLGLGAGAGAGGAVYAAGLLEKKAVILQSAKLLVSIREIFLNDEHDITYSNSVYEMYVQNIIAIEKGLVELRIKADTATGSEKKELLDRIKQAEDSVKAMKAAKKSMERFISSFTVGQNNA